MQNSCLAAEEVILIFLQENLSGKMALIIVVEPDMVLDIFLVFMKVQTLFVGDQIPKILTQYYSQVWSSQMNQVFMFLEIRNPYRKYADL